MCYFFILFHTFSYFFQVSWANPSNSWCVWKLDSRSIWSMICPIACGNIWGRVTLDGYFEADTVRQLPPLGILDTNIRKMFEVPMRWFLDFQMNYSYYSSTNTSGKSIVHLEIEKEEAPNLAVVKTCRRRITYCSISHMFMFSSQVFTRCPFNPFHIAKSLTKSASSPCCPDSDIMASVEVVETPQVHGARSLEAIQRGMALCLGRQIQKKHQKTRRCPLDFVLAQGLRTFSWTCINEAGDKCSTCFCSPALFWTSCPECVISSGWLVLCRVSLQKHANAMFEVGNLYSVWSSFTIIIAKMLFFCDQALVPRVLPGLALGVLSRHHLQPLQQDRVSEWPEGFGLRLDPWET